MATEYETRPVPQSLVNKIAKLITTELLLNPGEELFEVREEGRKEPKDIIVLGEIGRGLMGARQYAGVKSYSRERPPGPVAKEASPFETSQHHLVRFGRWLSRQDETDQGDDITNWKTDIVQPLTERLSRTRQSYDTEELRQLPAAQDNPLAYEKVAIKYWPHGRVDFKEIEREMLIHKELDHKNVPHYIDFFKTDKGYALVTRYIDGKPVKDLPSDDSWKEGDEKHLPGKAVLSMAWQAYDLADYFDGEDIIYQDYNLGNFMLGFNGRLYQIDFGKSEKITGSILKDPGGDRNSLAPEVIAKLKPTVSGGYSHSRDVPLDRKSPVWSIGVFTYFLVTNQLPFNEPKPNFDILQKKIMEGRYDPAAMYNTHGYDRALLRMLVELPLTVDPEKRPSAWEMKNLIQEYMLERELSIDHLANCREVTDRIDKERRRVHVAPTANVPKSTVETRRVEDEEGDED